MKVILKNVRLSFPNIVEPQTDQEGNKRYSADFIFEKGSDTHKRLETVAKEAAKERFGKNWEKILEAVKADKGRYPIQDGNEKINKDGEVWAGYEDMMYLRTSLQYKQGPVMLIDRDGTKISKDDERANHFYGGCYVNASINVRALDVKKQLIHAQILGVMFKKDGDALGNGARASLEDFEDLVEVDEADEIEF